MKINKSTEQAVLPTAQSMEGSRMSQLKWLIYGPPGIGKSTFFSKMVDGKRAPLFLHTDPGLRFIKTYKRPINSWLHFKKYVDALTTNPGNLYSVVVLDTIDLLFRMCRDEVCRKKNVDHISDLEYGKGYDMVRDQFELQISKLAVLDEFGIGLGFISYQKEVELRGRLTKTSKIVPTLPKQGHAVVVPMCDIIGYAGYDLGAGDKANETLQRKIYFEPSETLEAKDRTGLLPKSCPLDFDEVAQYLEEGVEADEQETATRRPLPSKKKKRKKRRA